MYNCTKRIRIIKFAATVLFLAYCCFNAYAQTDTTLKITLPVAGKLVHNKPLGKGWVNLLDTQKLKAEKKYWQFNTGILHGECKNENQHHYTFTKKTYKDFELNVLIKMTGSDDANSGVCIRIHPTDYDNVPGYQVDMGDGYWGCLWDEHHRQKKIVDFPKDDADKILHQSDWNHYYFRCVGHHITIFLNGIKTGDVEDEGGFEDGPLGFQLCHGANTVASFKNIYLKELK